MISENLALSRIFYLLKTLSQSLGDAAFAKCVSARRHVRLLQQLKANRALKVGIVRVQRAGNARQDQTRRNGRGVAGGRMGVPLALGSGGGSGHRGRSTGAGAGMRR